MRFAKIVFITAGVWGIVLLALNFLVDATGGRYAPPTAYPQFFYGFLVVALAWQVGFQQRNMARFLIEVTHDPERAAGMQQLGVIPGGAQPDTDSRVRLTRKAISPSERGGYLR